MDGVGLLFLYPEIVFTTASGGMEINLEKFQAFIAIAVCNVFYASIKEPEHL